MLRAIGQLKKFGYDTYGDYTCFRLNCNLLTEDVEELNESFHNATFMKIGKGLTRVEGAMHHEFFMSCFRPELAIAMKKFKVRKAQMELVHMQHSQNELANADPLPF